MLTSTVMVNDQFTHIHTYDNAEPVELAIDNDQKISGDFSDDDLAMPLGWLNSASIVTDADDDAVRFFVSVGDPRGAFQFTVRRMPDGELLIQTPTTDHPESHRPLRELFPGTLQVD
jgi:hypothetical protein